MGRPNDKNRLEGRNGRIWQLHLDGHTQEAIAEKLGIGQQRVSQIMAEVRKNIPKPTIEEIAQSEFDRITRLYMEATELRHSRDRGTRLTAMRLALDIHARVAKMYGLDVAQKLDATVAAQVRFQIEGIDVDHV